MLFFDHFSQVSRQQNFPTGQISSLSTCHRSRMESLSGSVVTTNSSSLDDMLVLKNDDKGGFGELSMVSFNEDESIKELTTPKVLDGE